MCTRKVEKLSYSDKEMVQTRNESFDDRLYTNEGNKTVEQICRQPDDDH